MLELKLYEVVQELNSRGEMGRVVVPPPPGVPQQNKNPRETGNFFLCCNRAFLTLDSLKKHKTSNCTIATNTEPETNDHSFKEIIQFACKGRMRKRFQETSTPTNEYTCTIVDVTAFIKKRKTNAGLITLCQMCEYSSADVQKIARHLKTVHFLNLQESQQVILDNDTLDTAYCDDQRLSHYFKCDVCDFYKTTQKSSMILHKKMAHATNGQYHCSYCTCRYETQTGLTLHLHRVHYDKIKERVKIHSHDKNTRDICNPDPTLGHSTCEVGSPKTLYVDTWVQQAADQLQILRFGQNKICERNSLETSYTIYKCELCPKIFDSESDLTTHGSHHYHSNQPLKEQPHLTNDNSIEMENCVQDFVSTCKFCKRRFESFELRCKHELICNSEKTIQSQYEITDKLNYYSKHVPEVQFEQLPTEMKTGNVMGMSRNYKPMNNIYNNIEISPAEISEEIGRSKNTNCQDKQFDLDENKCELCGFLANESKELGLHLKVAHVYLGVECECGCSFATATELTNHKSKECQRRNNEDINSKDLHSMNQEATTRDKKFTCACGEIFESRPKFRGHKVLCVFNSGTDDSLAQCNDILEKTGASKLTEMFEESCIQSIEPDTNGEANQWQENSINVETHICKHCDKSLTSALGLKRHIAALHKKVEDYSRCKLCGYPTMTAKSYKEHNKRCHTGSFKCPDCVCSFKDVIGLSRHAIVMHNKTIDKTTYLLRCKHPGCDFITYIQSGLKQHEMLSHLNGPLLNNETSLATVNCPICDLKTKNLQDHFSRAHVENGIDCPECKKCSFRSKLSLSRHLVAIHGKSLVKLKEPRDPTQYPLPCSKCDFRSKDEIGLNRHCVKIHGVSNLSPKINTNKCNICHAQTTETLVSHRKRYHVPNGFKCLRSDCSFSFETYNKRALHMAKAHQIKTVKPIRKCGICKLKVTETLRSHMKRCHVTGGFPCDFCSCAFETEQSRSMHMKVRHKSAVPTNCAICGIKPVVSMKAHLKQSHVAFGVPCGHCECTFKTKIARIGHLARYHNIIERLGPKVCSLCSMVIRIPMKQHLKRHHVENGYPCSHCSWSLPTEPGRTLHMFKLHRQQMQKYGFETNRKQCALCGVQVSESMNLHFERNHSSVNHFKCCYCCSKFSTNLGRTRHMNRRHAKEFTGKHIRIRKAGIQQSKRKNGHVLNKTQDDNSPEPKPIPIFLPMLETESEQDSSTQLQSFWIGGNTITKLAYSKSKGIKNQLIKVQNSISSIEDVPSLKSKPSTEDVKVKSPLLPKEMLTCPHCGYLASYKSHLNIHLQKSHVKNSPFGCNFCTCKYSSEKELHRHFEIFHPNESVEL